MNRHFPGHALCSLSPPMANEIEYVTPDMLRTELEAQDKRFDTKLETMLGAILARMDAMNARMDAMNARMDSMSARMDSIRDELRAEIRETRVDLARHANAIEESLRTQIAVIDDKYRDLPARVERLEQQPPPAPPRRRAQRR